MVDPAPWGPYSFRTPPTELAVGFGRSVPEGMPYGPCPGGQLGRFTPSFGWVPGSGCHEGAPDSAEATRPGGVRRRNSCGLTPR